MEQKNKNIICHSIDDITSIVTYLENAERGVIFYVLFQKRNTLYRNKNKTGVKTLKHFENIFKSSLPDNFLIRAIHESNSIRVEKLITYTEITSNQVFFKKCAEDYNCLANELMEQFQNMFKIKPYIDVPFITMNNYYENPHGSGELMGNWLYEFHGMELRFTNIITNQVVEIFLNYGGEFGVLDPLFFINYIKSTDKYKPLPVKLLHNFHDGHRVIEVMTELDLFEKIHSNFSVEPSREIIKSRDKKVIKVVNKDEFFQEILTKK